MEDPMNSYHKKSQNKKLISKSNKSKQLVKNNIDSKKKKKSAIPKPIANRMARRIAITTGLPTFSGMGVFILSYILVTQGIADIPPGITLLSSAGCFLLGLVGLSYGILSASWEEQNGTLLGIENIAPNISRIKDAFRSDGKTP